MRDPYSLLGVKRNAGVNEIKAAWRTKAKSIHPDHNQDDPSAGDRFAEVGQAYELLKDPERRKRYDRAADMQQTIMEQRETARQAAERAKVAKANAEKVMEELARANARRAQDNAQGAAHGEPNAQPASSAGASTKSSAGASTGAAGETPEDMIERIFGSGPQSQSSQSSQSKPEEQARPAEGAHAADSSSADAAAASPTAAHPEMGSDGKTPLPVLAVDLIASLVRRIRGTSAAAEKAPDLSVDAIVTVADLLQQNAVTVRLPDEREVRVPLDRGMTEGQVLRLKGQGLKVPNMKPGDLLVNLKLAKDAQYRVDGFNIHTVLPVSLEDAVLGTEVSLETLDGSRQVVIPAWSGSDQTIRIEGLGLHTGGGERGDLVVELRILLWEKPDPKVTDLMRHMRHGLFL
ncbi:J domain-containing protein [Neorhizobium lilium]|uniref:J domain-containing protein n=1 Tax=Neorhizobium lilium TaxID=2503024 RepID=A0A3S3RGH9_9HYPH|nr:DnaJ C-terminal domain-containing protein [Neorhizobium lilium]RWX77210.1 J domain-containing protein [Neorhizobium lilium]